MILSAAEDMRLRAEVILYQYHYITTTVYFQSQI